MVSKIFVFVERFCFLFLVSYYTIFSFIYLFFVYQGGGAGHLSTFSEMDVDFRRFLECAPMADQRRLSDKEGLVAFVRDLIDATHDRPSEVWTLFQSVLQNASNSKE